MNPLEKLKEKLRVKPSMDEIQYKKVEIAPNIYLTFQRWGDNSRKPYFIILWRGSKYIMEFELSQIIFKTDNVLTWILNVPTRKENKKTLMSS